VIATGRPQPAALSRRAFVLSALAASGCGILLSACNSAARPSPPTAAPASLSTLRIADAQVSGNFLPTYVAVDGGIFQSSGLEASLTVSQSSATMASLLAGQIDVAETSGAELVNALAGGADLVAVTTLVPVYPFRLFVQASIQQPDDLKGKTIGITSFGSAIDLATRVALSHMGLDPQKDVTLLPLSALSARTSAMLSGQIAGGLSLPPDWITLESAGLHSIFDLAEAGIATSVVMQIVPRSYVTDRRDLVQSFVDAIVRAIAREKRDEAFATAELQKRLNYDDAHGLKETYDFFANVVHPALPYPEVAQLQEAYDYAKQANPALGNVDLASAVDRSFVQSAATRGLQTA
jgi:NitT/TauT family transport system substrate-binding protein